MGDEIQDRGDVRLFLDEEQDANLFGVGKSSFMVLTGSEESPHKFRSLRWMTWTVTRRVEGRLQGSPRREPAQNANRPRG